MTDKEKIQELEKKVKDLTEMNIKIIDAVRINLAKLIDLPGIVPEKVELTDEQLANMSEEELQEYLEGKKKDE